MPQKDQYDLNWPLIIGIIVTLIVLAIWVPMFHCLCTATNPERAKPLSETAAE